MAVCEDPVRTWVRKGYYLELGKEHCTGGMGIETGASLKINFSKFHVSSQVLSLLTTQVEPESWVILSLFSLLKKTV